MRKDGSCPVVVRRSLDFCDKPCSNKTFYLDVKNDEFRKKVTKRIKSLGGKIEEFLSKDVDTLLTDGKTDKKNGVAPTGTKLLEERRVSVPLSRGKALLLKATQQQSSTASGQMCVNSVDIVQNALNLGVRVEKIKDFLKSTTKAAQKIKQNCSKSEDIDGITPLKWKNAEKENLIVLKVEDVDQIFRPFIKHLDMFPQPRFDENLVSPFDRGVVLSRTTEKHNNRYSTAKKNSSVLLGKKGGFCEACDYWYRCSLREHLNSEKHLKFVRNMNNFEVLDQIVMKMPGIPDFIAKFVPDAVVSMCKSDSGLGDISSEMDKSIANTSDICLGSIEKQHALSTIHINTPMDLLCQSPHLNTTGTFIGNYSEMEVDSAMASKGLEDECSRDSGTGPDFEQSASVGIFPGGDGEISSNLVRTKNSLSNKDSVYPHNTDTFESIHTGSRHSIVEDSNCSSSMSTGHNYNVCENAMFLDISNKKCNNGPIVAATSNVRKKLSAITLGDSGSTSNSSTVSDIIANKENTCNIKSKEPTSFAEIHKFGMNSPLHFGRQESSSSLNFNGVSPFTSPKSQKSTDTFNFGQLASTWMKDISSKKPLTHKEDQVKICLPEDNIEDSKSIRSNRTSSRTARTKRSLSRCDSTTGKSSGSLSSLVQQQLTFDLSLNCDSLSNDASHLATVSVPQQLTSDSLSRCSSSGEGESQTLFCSEKQQLSLRSRSEQTSTQFGFNIRNDDNDISLSTCKSTVRKADTIKKTPKRKEAVRKGKQKSTRKDKIRNSASYSSPVSKVNIESLCEAASNFSFDPIKQNQVCSNTGVAVGNVFASHGQDMFSSVHVPQKPLPQQQHYVGNQQTKPTCFLTGSPHQQNFTPVQSPMHHKFAEFQSPIHRNFDKIQSPIQHNSAQTQSPLQSNFGQIQSPLHQLRSSCVQHIQVPNIQSITLGSPLSHNGSPHHYNRTLIASSMHNNAVCSSPLNRTHFTSTGHVFSPQPSHMLHCDQTYLQQPLKVHIEERLPLQNESLGSDLVITSDQRHSQYDAYKYQSSSLSPYPDKQLKLQQPSHNPVCSDQNNLHESNLNKQQHQYLESQHFNQKDSHLYNPLQQSSVSAFQPDLYSDCAEPYSFKLDRNCSSSLGTDIYFHRSANDNCNSSRNCGPVSQNQGTTDSLTSLGQTASNVTQSGLSSSLMKADTSSDGCRSQSRLPVPFPHLSNNDCDSELSVTTERYSIASNNICDSMISGSTESYSINCNTLSSEPQNEQSSEIVDVVNVTDCNSSENNILHGIMFMNQMDQGATPTNEHNISNVGVSDIQDKTLTPQYTDISWNVKSLKGVNNVKSVNIKNNSVLPTTREITASTQLTGEVDKTLVNSISSQSPMHSAPVTVTEVISETTSGKEPEFSPFTVCKKDSRPIEEKTEEKRKPVKMKLSFAESPSDIKKCKKSLKRKLKEQHNSKTHNGEFSHGVKLCKRSDVAISTKRKRVPSFDENVQYVVRPQSATKIKLCRIMVTPVQQKSNLKTFWKVQKSSGARLLLSSEKKKRKHKSPRVEKVGMDDMMIGQPDSIQVEDDSMKMVEETEKPQRKRRRCTRLDFSDSAIAALVF